MTIVRIFASVALLAINPSPTMQHAVQVPPRYTVTIEGTAFGGFGDLTINQSPTATFLANASGESGRSKVELITLKRGVADGSQLYAWMHSKAGKTVVIVGSTASGQKVIYHLKNCIPERFSGPTLSAKSSDVALEELVLSAESISINYPSP